MSSAHPDLPVEDLGDVLLAPGFVDVHCHTEWSLSGGIAPGPGFGRWLRAFLEGMVVSGWSGHEAAADLGVLAAVRAGTTTLCDQGPLGCGVDAATAAGVRAVVCLEVFGESADRVAPLAERVALLASRAGPRVAVGISPHAPYSVGPVLWEALAAHEVLGRVPWTTHVAESVDEELAIAGEGGPLTEAMLAVGAGPRRWPATRGASVVARMAAGGALRDGLVAAHCVRLAPDDPAVLAAMGVRVAHCPVSNSRLGCGRMPLEALDAAGVIVGLGTDSPGSAGAYDVRAEARACEVLHGATGSPPSPARLVELATLGGARALGLDARIGSIEPGKSADLVAVRPGHGTGLAGDPHEALLRADSRVLHSWVAGEALLRDGEACTLDAGRIEALAGEARRVLC
ncbi:MAG: amidohydrolase family protein [Thermoleophilia bacterium]|nr:amidohydrolase family protein [Thermoleophilia bacterium]